LDGAVGIATGFGAARSSGRSLSRGR
jgi:hypothetical protein